MSGAHEPGCTFRSCLEGDSVRLHSRSGAFEVWLGYLVKGGEPFSALVTDSRSGAHLHFPAADVLGAASGAAGQRQRRPGRAGPPGRTMAMTPGDTEARTLQLKAERDGLRWWSLARWRKTGELRRAVLGSAPDGERR